MSKPATIKPISAAKAAAKRAGMISLCRDELLPLSKCQEALAQIGAAPMTTEEIAAYEAPITAADVCGEEMLAAQAAREAARKVEAEAKAKPAKPSKPAVIPAGVPADKLKEQVDGCRGYVVATFKATCPDAVAEYKERKAKDRYDAFAFAARTLFARFGV
jgi:hypothetical protein